MNSRFMLVSMLTRKEEFFKFILSEEEMGRGEPVPTGGSCLTSMQAGALALPALTCLVPSSPDLPVPDPARLGLLPQTEGAAP